MKNLCIPSTEHIFRSILEWLRDFKPFRRKEWMCEAKHSRTLCAVHPRTVWALSWPKYIAYPSISKAALQVNSPNTYLMFQDLMILIKFIRTKYSPEIFEKIPKHFSLFCILHNFVLFLSWTSDFSFHLTTLYKKNYVVG